MNSAHEISSRIMDAILSERLAAGARLGEQELAALYSCSRTVVREALTRLSVRGIVTVEPRRGWYVAELSQDEAREVFEARRIIETGLLRGVTAISQSAMERLCSHLQKQRDALERDDAGLRSLLLGDFHVCLAECLGNAVLAEMLRDLTARTTLAAARYQSAADAAHSFAEHKQIVDAIMNGDFQAAERLMAAHLGSWDHKLHVPSKPSSLDSLREALRPVAPKLPDYPPPTADEVLHQHHDRDHSSKET